MAGLSQEPLGEREAKAHFGAIVEGLLFIHSAGVLHRDVKPENVLRSANGGRPSVKLADFGVSSTFQPQRRRSSSGGGAGGTDMLTDTAGTAAFHAPEVRPDFAFLSFCVRPR